MTETMCLNCGESITEDDNGAGGRVWVHDFGSTVCYDDPPGSLEEGDTTTVAEPISPGPCNVAGCSNDGRFHYCREYGDGTGAPA